MTKALPKSINPNAVQAADMNLILEESIRAQITFVALKNRVLLSRDIPALNVEYHTIKALQRRITTLVPHSIHSSWLDQLSEIREFYAWAAGVLSACNNRKCPGGRLRVA